MALVNAQWPGEREASYIDVANANELPEESFLFSFKQALIGADIPQEYDYSLSSFATPVSEGLDTGVRACVFPGVSSKKASLTSFRVDI